MIQDFFDPFLRPFFNKYGVTNVQDLTSLFMSKFKSVNTPEKAVQEAIDNGDVAPHLDEINRFFEIYRLGHVLDFELYDEVNQVYQTGSGFGFILSGTTLLGAGESTAELLNGLFNVGIPEGACIQFLLLASGELTPIFKYWKSQRKSNPIFDKIADNRINFLNKGTKKRLYPRNKMSVKNFKLYISFTFNGLFQEDSYGVVDNVRNAAASLLKSQGIDSRNLPPDEFINLCREMLCPRQDGIQFYEYDDTLAIKDQIADPDENIYIDQDGIVINDTSIRTLGVRKYPTHLYLNNMGGVIGDELSAMLQIPYPFALCCNIQILNPETTNATLRLEAERVQNQAKNGIGRYLPIINRKAHEYQYMQQILADGEGCVNVGHFFHIYTPLGKSEEAFQEAQAVFRSRGFELVNYKNIQFPALLSSIPLFFDPDNAKQQKEARMMRLYRQFNAVNGLPVIADWKGTGTPVLMFLGRRGQVQFVDLFDNKAGNYNFAVVAVSGSGKSYLMNDIAQNYLACGSLVRIIDVGRSYKHLCEMFGGQFIEFGEKSNICINPFSFISDKDGNDLRGIDPEDLLKDEDLKEQVLMLKSIVMLAAGRDPENKTEDSFVEQAILSAVAEKGSHATFTTIYNFLIKFADDKGRARDIAQSIYSYTDKGVYGVFFEGVANLNFNNPFIVLELEELNQKGQLIDVVLQIVMLRITQEMYLGDRSQRKICIIDEAWQLMGNGNSGKFIETAYRRARKYGGAVGTATQSIDDYFKNPTTTACWNNADIKFLLRQGAESKKEKFDEYTTRLLKSVTTEKGVYSEVMIQIGGKTCGVSRLVVDPFSNYIFSSNANDVQLVNYVSQNEELNTTEAIERALFITDTYVETYHADPSDVSQYLVPNIKDYGYWNIINELLIVCAIKNADQCRVDKAQRVAISLIEDCCKIYAVQRDKAMSLIIEIINESGVEGVRVDLYSKNKVS